eukprot:351281-Chlamydomonas_euryale.AAC.2
MSPAPAALITPAPSHTPHSRVIPPPAHLQQAPTQRGRRHGGAAAKHKRFTRVRRGRRRRAQHLAGLIKGEHPCAVCCARRHESRRPARKVHVHVAAHGRPQHRLHTFVHAQEHEPEEGAGHWRGHRPCRGHEARVHAIAEEAAQSVHAHAHMREWGRKSRGCYRA